jgi:hypothetical protein
MASNRREILRKVVLSELADDDDVLAVALVGSIVKVSSFTVLRLLPRDENNPEAHIVGYVDNVVPRYSDFQFKSHFRLYRDAFEVSS